MLWSLLRTLVWCYMLSLLNSKLAYKNFYQVPTLKKMQKIIFGDMFSRPDTANNLKEPQNISWSSGSISCLSTWQRSFKSYNHSQVVPLDTEISSMAHFFCEKVLWYVEQGDKETEKLKLASICTHSTAVMYRRFPWVGIIKRAKYNIYSALLFENYEVKACVVFGPMSMMKNKIK